MILGLVGHMRTGKDTIADYLVNQHSFVRLAFADKLKEVALEIDPIIGGSAGVKFRLTDLVFTESDWDGAKGHPEVRQFLQRLGVAMRHVDPEIWLRPVRRALQEGGNFVITDVRFPNEARLVESYDGTIVRVTRNTGITDRHESETALDAWDTDYRIENNGSLADLFHQVRDLLIAAEQGEY